MSQFMKRFNRSRLLKLRHSARRFSKYENYTITSLDYDSSRRPVGMKIMEQHLSEINRNINKSDYSKYNMLDLGCGTGNYIEELYNMGIGNIYGIELNDGMYVQCFKKHENKIKEKTVHLFKGSIIPEIPFDDNMFNAICMNQVAHHLDDEVTRSENFKNIRIALKECHRCLNENGVLFINASTPIQILVGMWYNQFIPNTAEISSFKTPINGWFMKELKNSGFQHVTKCVIKDESLWDMDSFYNLEGIFKKEWRNQDSTFALINEDELLEAQNAISIIMKTKEKRNAFIAECEERRQRVGQSTTYIAYK